MRASLPQVTIAQRVIDAMVHGALIYNTETGEALIGLAVANAERPEPDIVILETIAPDATAVRQSVYFEQGDDWQSDVVSWLSDNWDDVRKGTTGKAKIEPRWNVPLVHIGDWHKHPGSMTEPSFGDMRTARSVLADKHLNASFLLAILATVWERTAAHAAVEAMAEDDRPILVDPSDEPGLTIRLDCWHMSHRTRRFLHTTPIVQPNEALPTLPILGWHLAAQGRMRWEIVELEKAGYAVISVDQQDVDHLPPRELCLTLERQDGGQVLIAVTQADYPLRRPEVRLVPVGALTALSDNSDMFAVLWPQSRPLPPEAYPSWGWSPSHSLGELAEAIDQALEHKPQPAPINAKDISNDK